MKKVVKVMFSSIFSILMIYSLSISMICAEVEDFAKYDSKVEGILDAVENYEVPETTRNNKYSRSIYSTETVEEEIITQKTKFKEEVFEKNENIIWNMSPEIQERVVEAVFDKELTIGANSYGSGISSDGGINGSFNDRGRTTNWLLRSGNILYTNVQVTKNFRHGHVAIISNVDGYVYEATTTVHNDAKVFHWSYQNMWARGTAGTVWEISPTLQKKINGTWIARNTPPIEKQRALQYAKRQVGKPYGLNGELYAETNFYCSKLVQRAFESVPTDARGFKFKVSTIEVGIVLPIHIATYKNTVVWKKIGTRSVYDYK